MIFFSSVSSEVNAIDNKAVVTVKAKLLADLTVSGYVLQDFYYQVFNSLTPCLAGANLKSERIRAPKRRRDSPFWRI